MEDDHSFSSTIRMYNPIGNRRKMESIDRLYKQTRQAYSLKDLDQAIALYRDALKLRPSGHVDHPSIFHKLARCLVDRFLREHESCDLDEAFTLVQQALELFPSEHPDRSSSLHTLARCLCEQFKKDRKRSDLDGAIAAGREVLVLHPPGHPDRSSSLHSLSVFLRVQFIEDGRIEDLEEAITLCRDAVDLRSPENPHRHLSLSNLAACLNDRYFQEHKVADLDEAIAHESAALDLRPPGHPDRSQSLHDLALFLRNKFSVNRRMDDLERAIEICRAAIDLRPPGDPDRHWSLSNLSCYLHDRFLTMHSTADLDEAITHARAALDLRPLGHPARVLTFRLLAILLCSHFNKYGRTEDLKEAISFVHAAIDLRSLGQPGWALVINQLLIPLRKQYSGRRAIVDLEEIITLGRAILDLQPREHSGRDSSIESFEYDVMEMIDNLRSEMNLDKAIELGREIVALRLPGDPGRSPSLTKLIQCFEERFQKQGAISDLDELIMLHRDTLDLHPPGNQTRPRLLHDLARCLSDRFHRQKDISNLEEAISIERTALTFRQKGHPDHAVSLYTLVHFVGEYSKAGKATNLEDLMVLGRAIMELGTSGHPEHASSLRNLVLLISSGLGQAPVVVDMREVMTFAMSALRLCPTQHCDRPILIQRIAACRRKKLKIGAKPVLDGIKKLAGDVVNEVIKDLPTRLLNTLTGRLCGRHALMSDFYDSTQYKELLASVEISESVERNARVQETVSEYFQYAILSHCWGSDEPLLRGVQGQVIYDMEPTDGILKLQSFCTAAFERHYMWAWSDTCCIDKESSAELQESIGSMFEWYRRSGLTIVYLADISDDGALSSSGWFKRGWILQELLAPRFMLIFTQEWLLYGGRVSSNHKEDPLILTELEGATKIPQRYLTHFHPGTDDARSRLEWASARLTTRAEDMAYSLFGVFNLHLPVMYGEPKESCLGRLLAEIISQSGDISILDWVGEASPFHSCFPAHISAYQTAPRLSSHANQIQPSALNTNEIVSSLAELSHSLSTSDRPQWIGRQLRLPCISHRVTAIQLKETRGQQYVYYIHAEGLTPLEVEMVDKLKGHLRTYTLVRPCHAKLLGTSTEMDGLSTEQLGMELEQPFTALLLEKLPQNEYRRIASNSAIVARFADAQSILRNNFHTFNIV